MLSNDDIEAMKTGEEVIHISPSKSTGTTPWVAVDVFLRAPLLRQKKTPPLN